MPIFLDCFVPRNDGIPENLDCFVPRNDEIPERLDCFVPRFFFFACGKNDGTAPLQGWDWGLISLTQGVALR
ncbi:MAG: hypothetical protein LBR18_01605 [Tannerella sp.]|jgi:hypothetical protein|nr:hypothetical protein [Tannerella sp.]